MRFQILVGCSLLAMACTPSKVQFASLTGCTPESVTVSDRSDWGYDVLCDGEEFICAYTGRGEARNLSCSPRKKPLDDAVTARAESKAPAPEIEATPQGLGGFDFGQSPEQAETACTEAGHSWTPKDKRYACTGLSSTIGISVSGVELVFCNNGLCEIWVESDDQPNRYVRVVNDLKKALSGKYGEGISKTELQSACLEEAESIACLKDGRAKIEHHWEWPTGQEITLRVVMGENAPRVRLHYVAGVNAGAL